VAIVEYLGLAQDALLDAANAFDGALGAQIPPIHAELDADAPQGLEGVVYLPTADKYRRLTRRLPKGQKDLEESAHGLPAALSPNSVRHEFC